MDYRRRARKKEGGRRKEGLGARGKRIEVGVW
jgi:hypothetical protein